MRRTESSSRLAVLGRRRRGRLETKASKIVGDGFREGEMARNLPVYASTT